MMSETIVIGKVEERTSTNGKQYISIVTDRNEKYSVWPDEKNKGVYLSAKELLPGNTAIIEFTQKGVFRNVSSIVVSEPVNGKPEKVVAPAGYVFNDKKDRRISRLACINSSIAFYEAIKPARFSAEDVLLLAEQFEKWVYRSDGE